MGSSGSNWVFFLEEASWKEKERERAQGLGRMVRKEWKER